jgi:predicted helicase
LIRQGVTDWTHEFLANGQVPDWICVCSDETVGNLERDEFVGEVYELGLPTHTEPKKIASLLCGLSKGTKIVFTTYQSSDKLAAAARLAGVKFDLAIFDEAHKTVGVRSKTFATLLRDRRFNARYRLFMTATERVFRGNSDEVLSMDNEDDYGKRFFHMSFKEAISQRIISDYKILTIAVSDERVVRVIEENRILNLHRAVWTRLRHGQLRLGLPSNGSRNRGSHTRFRSTPASVRPSASRTSRMSSIGCAPGQRIFTSQARRRQVNAPPSYASSRMSRAPL